MPSDVYSSFCTQVTKTNNIKHVVVTWAHFSANRNESVIWIILSLENSKDIQTHYENTKCNYELMNELKSTWDRVFVG